MFQHKHKYDSVGIIIHILESLYLRIGWKTEKAEDEGSVLMPVCHGFGSFQFEQVKLRFLVIDKLGPDLEKHFCSGENPLPLVTVLRVAHQVIDTLEFVHSHNYVHNDVKAQNLLTGVSNTTSDNVYLIDFGLACKYK